MRGVGLMGMQNAQVGNGHRIVDVEAKLKIMLMIDNFLNFFNFQKGLTAASKFLKEWKKVTQSIK